LSVAIKDLLPEAEEHRSPFATAVVYGLEMGFSPKLNPVPQGWT
jgi:hypothetical protein